MVFLFHLKNSVQLSYVDDIWFLVPLFDDLTKKEAKFTEKTIEKSSELVDTAKTKVSIKSAEADLDDQFIELGKLYYEVLNKDNVFDEKAAPVVQKIDEINQRIENLKSSLEKE